MNIKRLSCTTALAVTIAAGGIAIEANSAHAARIYFTPAGNQLDLDNPPDLIRTPGQNITFNLYLDTTGLTQNVTQFDYFFQWDRNELGLLSSTVQLPAETPPPALVERSLIGLNIAPGVTNFLLESVTFSVTNGLKNGLSPLGGADFRLVADAVNGVPVDDIRAFRDGRRQGVDVQPIPTPALLPGLIAVGLGWVRKRKAEVSIEANA